MRSPVGAEGAEAPVEPPSSPDLDSDDGSVEQCFHNGRAIQVVTGALPSGGFVILHIRVLALDRQHWIRVSAASFWSFDDQTAAANHGRALAISAIHTQLI
jgi:hypothetical protein